MIIALQSNDFHVTTRDCDEGTRLFVWCVRRWVEQRFQRRDPKPNLRAALFQHQMPETAEEIDGLMQCIAGHAVRKLEVSLTAGVDLSSDETTLSRAIAAAEEQSELADALLLTLIDHAGAGSARTCLTKISAAFRISGLEFGLPAFRKQPSAVEMSSTRICSIQPLRVSS